MFYIAFIFIIGLLVGSFLNNYIFRLHRDEQVVAGRSHCDNCEHTLSWYELIPVVSWIGLRGACRSCRRNIDIQYPLVELATGLLFALTFNFFMQNCLGGHISLTTCSAVNWLTLIRNVVIVSYLIVIFVYDLRWQLILDTVTIPAMVLVFVLQTTIILVGGVHDNGFTVSIDNATWTELANLLLAFLIGGGFFLAQFVLSQGRWIGGGDIRLGALMGLILGWPDIIWALMFAYVIGAITALLLIAIKKKSWTSQVPFGTFLSLACIIMLYWGDKIVAWYISLLI